MPPARALRKVLNIIVALAFLCLPTRPVAALPPTPEAPARVADSGIRQPLPEPRLHLSAPAASTPADGEITVFPSSSTGSAITPQSGNPDLAFDTPSGWSGSFYLSKYKDAAAASSLMAGQQVYLTFSIQNLGADMDAFSVFEVCAYVDDVQAGCAYDGALNSGSSLIYHNLSIGAVDEPGTHTVKLIIEPEGMIQEEDTANNTVEADLAWGAAPASGYTNLKPYSGLFNNQPFLLSLHPSMLTSSTLLMSDAPAYLNWAITNAGSLDLAENAGMKVQLKINDTEAFSQVITEGIPASETFSQINQTVAAMTLTPDMYEVQLIIDPDDAVVESDEGDNSYTTSLAWTDTPFVDLTPASPNEWNTTVAITSTPGSDGSPWLYADSDAYAHVAVRNIGSLASGVFKATVQLDGQQLTEYTFDSLAPDALAQKLNLKIPAGQVTPGWHTLTLTVDPALEIAESDDLNNRISVDFKWGKSSQPNLHPYQPSGWDDALVFSNQTDDHANTSLTEGANIYFDHAFINDGGSDIPGGAPIVIRLTIDGQIANDRTHLDGLPKDFMYSYSDQLLLLTAGWHHIEYAIDPLDSIQESDETDNTAQLWIFVGPQGGAPALSVSPSSLLLERNTGLGLGPAAEAERYPRRIAGASFDRSSVGTGAEITSATAYVNPTLPLIPADASELPTAISHSALMPPVGNQGGAGSCTSWAVSYYYKSFQEGLDHGWDLTQASHQFSPNFVWNQIQPSAVCGGTWSGDAFELLSKQGDVSIEVMPYEEDCKLQPTASQKEIARDYRAQDYGLFFNYATPLTDDIIHQMKTWIANGGIIQLSVTTPPEFNNPSGPYCVVDLPTLGESGGNHAITITGYDDNIGDTGKQGFQIVNSWGTTWGCSGYAYLTYDWVKNYSYEAWWMRDTISGANYRDVTLQNNGASDLTITGIEKSTGSPWLLVNLPQGLPFRVHPGESATLQIAVDTTLAASANSQATLTITSDDPAQPVSTVAIHLRTGVADSPAPAAAAGPWPANAAGTVWPKDTRFSWAAESQPDGVLYDLRLGDSNPPTTVVCNDLDSSSCVVGALRPNTTYYWQVVSQTSMKATLSPIWSFTTGSDTARIYLPVVRRN